MGLSRNKVAVPEGAAGSPPFYGVFAGRLCGVRVVGRPVRPPCVGWGVVLAGVEEIEGLVSGLRGRGSWCGACCWVPGSPRLRFVGVGGSSPVGRVRCRFGVVRGLWCGGGLRTGEWTRATAMLPLLCGGVVGVRTVNEPRRIVLSLSGGVVRPGCIRPWLAGVCVRSFVSCRPCPFVGVWLMCVMI